MNMRTEAYAVADQIGRLVTWARRYATAELSTTAVTTLDTLASAGPLRVSELARHERVSQPGMTALVNRLEAAGQAERVADPTDRRVVLVRITTQGRKVLADRHAARTAALQDQIAALPAADRRALTAALPSIARLIASSPHSAADPRAVGASPQK